MSNQYYLYHNHFNYSIVSVDSAVVKTSDHDKNAPNEGERKNKLSNGKILLYLLFSFFVLLAYEI